jgi:hypothetical protein
MNEDEILSFDYRSPAKKESKWENFYLPKTVMENRPKTLSHNWCEVGTKITGYQTKSTPSKTFGIVDNVFRADHRVNIKWSNGTTIGYDIDYLSTLIDEETIEILYERK